MTILPEQDMRIETSVIRFGKDWPGIFIRGDDAFRYMMALRILIHSSKIDSFYLEPIEGLIDLLGSSNLESNEKHNRAADRCTNNDGV